jgi:anti-anti-sigma factor
MAETLKFEVDRSGGRAVVMRVRGRIDGRTAPDLMKRGLAEQAPDPVLVLNLAEVTFVSSAGVGALMVLADTAARQGGGVRLAPASEAVLSVLRVLNLDSYLAIDESESVALRAVAG